MNDMLKNNPLLNGMDPQKLQFILDFAQQEKPASMNAAMPFLLANMNQAKKQNIQFSKPEIQLIAEILTQNLSQNEKDKVNRIMSMMLK